MPYFLSTWFHGSDHQPRFPYFPINVVSQFKVIYVDNLNRGTTFMGNKETCVDNLNREATMRTNKEIYIDNLNRETTM